MKTLRTCALLVGLAAVCPSCTQSLELDRFHKAQTAAEQLSQVSYLDLRFDARSMQSHIDEYLELRIVDKNDRVQAKAVYVGVVNPDFVMQMPRIVPKTNPPYRIDMWADHNNSKKYDGIEGGVNDKDHAWRRMLSDPLPEDVKLVGTRYDFTFLHDTAFVDIFTNLDGNPISGADTLLNFNLRVKNAAGFPGKMVEVRVYDKASNRLVGLHRAGRPAGDVYTAQVLGVVDEETAYHVTAFVDADGDGTVSSGDPTWNADFVSTSTSLDAELDLAALPQSPVELDRTQ